MTWITYKLYGLPNGNDLDSVEVCGIYFNRAAAELIKKELEASGKYELIWLSEVYEEVNE